MPKETGVVLVIVAPILLVTISPIFLVIVAVVIVVVVVAATTAAVLVVAAPFVLAPGAVSATTVGPILHAASVACILRIAMLVASVGYALPIFLLLRVEVDVLREFLVLVLALIVLEAKPVVGKLDPRVWDVRQRRGACIHPSDRHRMGDQEKEISSLGEGKIEVRKPRVRAEVLLSGPDVLLPIHKEVTASVGVMGPFDLVPHRLGEDLGQAPDGKLLGELFLLLAPGSNDTSVALTIGFDLETFRSIANKEAWGPVFQCRGEEL
mmetsp:Transcript_88300/g.193524  ORF Transcript_88300/g.193524 Transcript_88300/m.193524 type:complete len:266 (+) Transcript_88300:470-1267(+)